MNRRDKQTLCDIVERNGIGDVLQVLYSERYLVDKKEINISEEVFQDLQIILKKIADAPNTAIGLFLPIEVEKAVYLYKHLDKITNLRKVRDVI